MTIFVNSDTRVIVQGMTGAEGRKHTQRMLSAGTAVVGGTNPRKAGTTVAFDVVGYGPGAGRVADGQVEVPVYGTVAEARELIAAFDEALAAGSGVATFHGRMIENLHVEAAHRTVDMFEAVRGR